MMIINNKSSALQSLQSWPRYAHLRVEKALKDTYNFIRNNIFKLEIFTDVSLTGWGSALQSGEKARGWWTDINKNEYINMLELRAAQNGLKCHE